MFMTILETNITLSSFRTLDEPFVTLIYYREEQKK